MSAMSTTDTRTASEIITDEVTSWPGVTAATGSRGEWSLKAVWQELYDAGRITYHPVFPDKKGWAARQIESDDDVRDVIAMLRLNYDRSAGR